jgi:hypothetical protein
MTDREKAIVMAYTGKCMLTEDKFHIFHEYIEEIMGRPVFTHELADRDVSAEIKEKAKADFIALCDEEEHEPCEDCVSRRELIDKLEIVDKMYGSDFYWEIRRLVDRLQPVRPIQKKGKWIKRGTEEKYDLFGDRVKVATYKCSVCGRIIEDIGTYGVTNRIENYPYCHCGSKNEVEE